MARISRRDFVAGAAAATSLGASRTAASANLQAGDNPIAGTVTIGVVGPFTGDQIRLGEQIGNGVRAALDDANQLKGTLDKAFTSQTFDDQNLLASGLVNAQFACDNSEVIAVIGHLSGRITEAAMPTYQNAQMQVICPASSYDRLTSHGYGNILRLQTKDSTEGRLAARYINKTIKPKQAVGLYQDGDYGADVMVGFLEQMQGDKVNALPISFSWSKPDFVAVTKQILAAKPDVVFLAGETGDMGGLLPALATAGYTGPIYASQGFFDAQTIAKYGAAAEGLTISSSMPPLTIAPGAFRIKNDFENKYGAMTPLAAFAYAAAQIVVSVVPRRVAANRCTSTGAPAIGAPSRSVSRPDTSTGAEALPGFVGAVRVIRAGLPASVWMRGRKNGRRA